MNSMQNITLSEVFSHHEKQPHIGVGVIVHHEERVLLGKHKSNYGAEQWSFPGGYLRFGESPEVCARRELMRESGLKARRVLPGPWTSDVIAKDHHFVTLFMIVPEFEGRLEPREPQNCENWCWFDWDALPNPLFLPLQTLINSVGLERLKTELGLCS